MSGVPTSLRLSCIPPENASITCSGHHSILQSEGAIDEDVLDPDRGLARIFIGGPGGDRIRVEDDDVSRVPGSDLPALVQPESLSRGERHMADRVGLARIFRGGAAVVRSRVEVDDGRLVPVRDLSAVLTPESLSRGERHVPDRLGTIEITLVADVGVHSAWDGALRARMGPVPDE